MSTIISIPLIHITEEETEKIKKDFKKKKILKKNFFFGPSDFIGDARYPRVCTVTIGDEIALPLKGGKTNFNVSNNFFSYNSIKDKINWVAAYITNYYSKNKEYPLIKEAFEKVMYSDLEVLKVDYDSLCTSDVDSSKWDLKELEDPENMRRFIFSKEGYILGGLTNLRESSYRKVIVRG